MSDDNFLRYEEAAKLLRCCPQTLRKRVCYRQIPFIKPYGKRGMVLFSENDLRAFLEASRVEPVGAWKLWHKAFSSIQQSGADEALVIRACTPEAATIVFPATDVLIHNSICDKEIQ
jgi:excisionase family DNA binding protein